MGFSKKVEKLSKKALTGSKYRMIAYYLYRGRRYGTG
jgi:hypothetical protein